MNTSDCVDTVYKEREEFIIIGLTGRTGSGCSEAAKILSKENFKELSLRKPKNLGCRSVEERKYKIIYDYAEKNWEGFEVIRMSTIVYSFLMQKEYTEVGKIFKEILPSLDTKTLIQKYEEFSKKYSKVRENLTEVLEDNTLLRNQLSKEYYIYKEVKILHQKMKEILQKESCRVEKSSNGNEIEYEEVNVYSYLWQHIANTIREYGTVLTKEEKIGREKNPKGVFQLAKRANGFIKAIRHHKCLNGKNALICIDAIRNPYEAVYFKDRYAAFYLISINTEEEERRRRLSSMNMEQINNLDKIESPKKVKGIKIFTNQNIPGCIEISDIHIHNPQSRETERFLLTKQLVKYITLIKHPGLVTPGHIECCMQIAFNARLNSGCLSRQVGAVITDENFSIKAVGWNDVPEGQISCALRDIRDLKDNRDCDIYSDFEIEDKGFNKRIDEIYDNVIAQYGYKGKLNGRCYQYCFKDVYETVTGSKNQVHTRALHAEENAFLQLSKYGGQGIKGGKLFCTASPCELCSKKAYQLGIREIYYIDPYPGISMKHILAFKNLHGENIRSILFTGAVGQAYTALYSQRISIKDELELLVGNIVKDLSNEEIREKINGKDVEFLRSMEKEKYNVAQIIVCTDEEITLPFYLVENKNTNVTENGSQNSSDIQILFKTFIDKLLKLKLIKSVKVDSKKENDDWIKNCDLYKQSLRSIGSEELIKITKYSIKITSRGTEIIEYFDRIKEKENNFIL